MSHNPATPPSSRRKGQGSAFRLLSIGLAVLLCACVRYTPVTRPASSCLTLVPAGIRAATPGAPLPADDSAGAWTAFANSQTGQLEIANAGKADALEIIERCEARDAETVRELTKRRGLFG